MMCSQALRRLLKAAMAFGFALVACLGLAATAFATEPADSTVDVVAEEGASLLGLTASPLAVNATPVVALDPGHGGSDAGASGNGLYEKLYEKDINWKISMATKEWLENHGVTVFLTHNGTELGADGSSTPSIYDRVQRAVGAGACVIVSQHINSGGGRGFEVWIPRTCNYYPNVNKAGHALYDSLKPKLVDLGLFNRGVKTMPLEGATYDNGDTADYYGVIRYARRAGTPGMIIEHAFVDNAEDAAKLKDDNFLKKLGVADAEAIYANLNTFYDAYKYNQEHPYRSEPIVEKAGDGATYRLYDWGSREHLFTTNYTEAEKLAEEGWRYEGVAWYNPETSSTPVYRLYNWETGEHLFTTDQHEYDTLRTNGEWNDEKIAWYSADEKGGVPVYRLYNPDGTGRDNHHYTTAWNEYDTLRNGTWVDEKIAWYAGSLKAPVTPSQTPSTPSTPAATGTPIMGASSTTKEALANRFASLMESNGKTYPALYAQKGAATARDFANVLWDQATSEGVRPEVLLAQVIWETGWLQFGGDVKPEQCNFGGIGATDNTHGVYSATFENVAQGLLAQAQHLKAYGSTEPLNNPCVDPRFNLVSRGCSPTVEGLGGRWATGANYGQNLVSLMERTLLG